MFADYADLYICCILSDALNNCDQNGKRMHAGPNLCLFGNCESERWDSQVDGSKVGLC